MPGRTIISRRNFLYAGAFLPLTTAAQRGAGKSPQSAESELPVQLLTDIPAAQLRDLSPDGSKLLLFCWRQSTRGFGWRRSETEKKSPLGSGKEPLRVIDLASLSTIYATGLPAAPGDASFFEDSESFYVGVPGAGNGATAHIVVDLHTRKKEEWLEPYNPEVLWFHYFALGGRQLLGAGHNVKKGLTEVLVLAEPQTGNYRETARVPYCLVDRGDIRNMLEVSPAVSSDRKTFVSTYGNNVVCRDTRDLGIRWIQQISNVDDVTLRCVTASPDGRLVAATASDRPQVEEASEYNVVICDGKDGRELTRLAVFLVNGLAISPDGKLLAGGLTIPNQSGVAATVLVYDIASGRRVATLVQDQFSGGGNQFLANHISGILFTPDGRHLITSGAVSTKIWEIGRS
jgi:hypothetical protein